jgi:hypothetical protein
MSPNENFTKDAVNQHLFPSYVVAITSIHAVLTLRLKKRMKNYEKENVIRPLPVISLIIQAETRG